MDVCVVVRLFATALSGSFLFVNKYKKPSPFVQGEGGKRMLDG